MMIIILKGWFNQSIKYLKGDFFHIINNNIYLRGRNIFLEIDQEWKVIKSVSG